MRRIDVEDRTLRAVEQAQALNPTEDSYVEFKREWIEPKKAARILAGHANAARGEEILWIIGVDEQTGEVPGAEPEELANWWPQVQACFDERAPDLDVTLNVQVGDGRAVVAMQFSTDLAPFVVKNAEGKGPEKEVPWRDGNRTISARRRDLVKMLVPVARLPNVEMLSAAINESMSNSYYKISCEFYFTVSDRVVIPWHDTRCNIVGGDGKRVAVDCTDGRFNVSGSSVTTRATEHELIVDGPGYAWIEMSTRQGYSFHRINEVSE